MSIRDISQVIPSMPTSDGAGVKLRRSIGATPELRVDPFLMLDEFYSDHPDDYLAGFPPHPHRGFETVTYMLDGRMQHRDHLGNTGDLGPGAVQWMTAARGIIHSEMPQQREGRMRGFQLWINLPAAEKMKAAAYRDIPAGDIPSAPLDGGGEARVIAGSLAQRGVVVEGPVIGAATDPLYLDIRLPAGASAAIPVPSGYSAFVYVYEGTVSIGDAGRELPRQAAVVFGEGDTLRLRAAGNETRLLLLAARPLREPVVQYGPFVMNTREEIEQTLSDYRHGRLAT